MKPQENMIMFSRCSDSNEMSKYKKRFINIKLFTDFYLF